MYFKCASIKPAVPWDNIEHEHRLPYNGRRKIYCIFAIKFNLMMS